MNILDSIFPEKCLYCKKYGKVICKSCYEKLDKKYIFEKIDNDYFDYMICGSFYEGVIRTQMHYFKFHEKSYLYQYFIELSLMNSKIYHFLECFDLITYIPMSYNKKIRRGYNQSELLAKELGKRLNIKVLNILEKTVENRTQSTLSESERMKNVQDVFQIKENVTFKNKNIILVDDIFTTGSTVRASSKILKENGANQIAIFVISKTKAIKEKQ